MALHLYGNTMYHAQLHYLHFITFDHIAPFPKYNTISISVVQYLVSNPAQQMWIYWEIWSLKHQIYGKKNHAWRASK